MRRSRWPASVAFAVAASVLSCGLVAGCQAPAGSPIGGSATPADRSPGPSPSPSPSPTARPGPAGASPTRWLCRPGRADDPCAGAFPVTVVAADGTRTTRRMVRAVEPAFDCFYVYPTASRASGPIAPLRVTPELVRVVRAQAVPFQRVCRLYAPVYRQITLAGLVDGAFRDPQARTQGQADVRAAFREYLERYNQGRPFLLLGHSQGATALVPLVQSEIDGDPVLRARLVSVMLIGAGPYLAAGSTTTGSFQNIPPCRSRTQAGCVVAYNSYDGRPPADGLFGRITGGRVPICVNPGAPAGGPSRLDPWLPVPSAAGRDDVVGFASFPGSVRAVCRSSPGFSWLDVRRVPGSQLPAATMTAGFGPAWGTHRVDVTLALGDLVALAAGQAATLAR